jgi:V8-like Glu-specific endopeptidase
MKSDRRIKTAIVAASFLLIPQEGRTQVLCKPIVGAGNGIEMGDECIIVNPGFAVGASARGVNPPVVRESSPTSVAPINDAPPNVAPTNVAPRILCEPRIVEGEIQLSDCIVQPGVAVGAIARGSGVQISPWLPSIPLPKLYDPPVKRIVGAGDSGKEDNSLPAELVDLGRRSYEESASGQAEQIPPEYQSGVGELGYLDLDSGLRDCDLPFEELAVQSPFCEGGGGEHVRCERFSISQFPEVLKIIPFFSNGLNDICSGTLIGPDWVLTAAHCFAANESAKQISGNDRDDVRWSPGSTILPLSKVMVEAANAKTLQRGDQRMRDVLEIVIHRDYGGRNSSPPYANDIAAVRLSSPYPLKSMHPAYLAMDKDFNSETTIAGYGFSNAEGGTLGQFQLTWPVPVVKQNGLFKFVPGQANSGEEGAFCQGDSGGPVFSGRQRGCKPVDVVPEGRPRILQGTISFNKLGMAGKYETRAMRQSARCMNATEMTMQDITSPERRNWICQVTGFSALGCS